jgi:hypothetical protein
VNPAPAPGGRRELSEVAVAAGAHAVAAFADRHSLAILAELREDLAREVLLAAAPHLATNHEPGD